MKKTHFLSGLLAVSLTSAALYAAPGTKTDANGDKSVTKTEALAAADARFAKLDVNADGVVNEADKMAMVKARFAKLDTDKNGSISESEFVAHHEARLEKRGERRQKRLSRAGADGMMGRHGSRRAAGMKMLTQMDSNGDRDISRSEFRAAAEARFTKADANADDTITADERKTKRGKWREKRPAAAPDAG